MRSGRNAIAYVCQSTGLQSDDDQPNGESVHRRMQVIEGNCRLLILLRLAADGIRRPNTVFQETKAAPRPRPKPQSRFAGLEFDTKRRSWCWCSPRRRRGRVSAAVAWTDDLQYIQGGSRMNSRPSQITESHLRRGALVYVRQSTTYQVETMVGSAAVQRDLRELLAAWGWMAEQIEVR